MDGLRAMVLLLAFMVFQEHASGQAFPIFNGTSNTCTGALLDSGGQGGSGYSNNESITYTVCPDAPGGAISLDFITFNLSTAGAAPIDNMVIHDGSSTAAPVLGTWTGNGLQGQVVSASGGNPTGCLTVVFTSNGAGVGVFAASITCYQPCARPTAVATHGVTGPLRICPGESVTFNSAGSFAAPGFNIASRRWDFGDGSVQNNAPVSVNHTYAQPGGYTAQLYLVDNNGCASTNRVDLQVFVGTAPTFPGTGGELLGCEGETLCIDGDVTGTTWNELPATDLGGGVFLPDEVGECFTSELTFTQFPPGQTLTNVNGIQTICMDMEHSFIGDLVISITSPSGETVVMHQQGGGATFLGEPVDDDLQPNDIGTCYTYCFSPSAANGTWVDNAGGTLASGTYESLNPLNGLLGSQLNGTWSLEVCDLWASDNGFICNWGITFDPSLFDDLITFTPVYGAGCDSSSWSGPNISSTGAGCNSVCVTPPSAGDYDYVYTVTDNFGCTYDTTLTVTIVPGPDVSAGPDASTCNTPVQLNATILGGGFPNTCDYVLSLYDSFGDGWTGLFGGANGSDVTITVNGVASSWTLSTGAGGSVNIPVTTGDVITLTYTAANFYNDEQSFALFDENGNAIYTSPLDPNNGLAWSGVAACQGGNFIYSWTPAAGLSNPNIANPIATVAGTTQYCVTVYQAGHPDCTSTDCMTITVDNTVDPGTNGAVTVCANGAAVNLLNELGGTPSAGGTWTDPGGGAHSGMFMPGADAAGVYTYTVSGSGACAAGSASSTVTVTVSPIADAGTSTSSAFCSNSAAEPLFNALGGSPQAGGTWSSPSGGAFGGTFDPAVHPSGLYTYTVPGVAPCPPAVATVSVTVTPPPDAGLDDAIALCSTGGPIVLLNELGGTPDGTGTWTDPGGAIIGGSIDPATAPAGNYTYTVNGANPCPSDAAILAVTINTPPDPGTDGTITLCSTDAAVSLFAQLGGTPDAGGVWSGPSVVVGGNFDPATMTAGVYTYTVNGIAPCPAETATVTVNVNTPPDPGTDGTITLCSTDAAVSLFAQLGGTPDAGGVWSGPSAVVAGNFDPATMTAGDYTYTVNGIAPCPAETATVTVNVNTPPDPGTDGTITLCSTDAAVSLFAQLGGTPDAGGTWSGPSAMVAGNFDPATMTAGAYTYTVNGIAPCPAETATVTVAVNTPPDPGVAGTITLCSTDAAVSLFAQLGGTPDAGGVWSGPSAVVAGNFDPATMTAGAYTYTVNGIAPCPAETATVTVNVNTPPDPGTDGAITLCSTDAAVSLFAQLGGTPDAGGVWSGPSAVVAGSFDPTTMTAGAYTYTVNGIAPCPAESATVTVNVNTPPDPGTDGTITLCSTDGAVSLFAQLGGSPDAGGVWSGPSAVVAGNFDPATMTAGAYTYTVNGIAPCPAETATVTVNVNTPPDPGTDGTITLCSTDAAVSLFAQLGGTPDAGGVWSGPSAVVAGNFDPATMTAGAYTYTVNGIPPCPAETATVTVNVNTPPDPGTDGTITLCSTDAAVSLFAQLGGTPDAGGVWSGPSAVIASNFDPATMTAGAYTYTVNGIAPCPAETATVTVAVNTPPDPGTDGAITLCSTDAAVSLFAQLGGSPDAGGVWSGPSAVVGANFDPATMTAGAYTYTVNGIAPCPAETATVTVNVNTPPDPGVDGTITLCSTDAAVSLFAQLGGTPDAGGVWSGPSVVVGGNFDPATMTAGAYTYTVNGIAPCPAETATVTVNVNTPPDPGTDGTITLCSTDAAVSLFAQLGGTPDAGGVWSGPSAVVAGNFDPATMAAGAYTYTVNGIAPCPAETATVTVNVNTPPDPGTDGTITLCSTDAAVSLFAQLGGTPDAGGVWSGPSPVVAGNFDPATMIAGDYTYTVNGIAPCPAETATVTVNVNTPPDPGTDGTITLCSTDATVSLFAQLGGTPDAGGVWSGPSAVVAGNFDPATMAAGAYTYTVNGIAPCPAETATVTVNVDTPPDPGTDGTITLCSTDAAVSLFAQLGGTPDAGGVWSGPSAVVAGNFDPATMAAGAYTYTVNGIAPCPSETATVTVNVNTPPDPGVDGTITLCSTDAAVALFTQLGGTPDAGGVWSGPSPVVAGNFDPATMTAGAHTYTVNGIAPCPAETATVTVNVNTPPDPGSDGGLTLCASSPATALINGLNGTPDVGGTWVGPGGSASTGIFTPGTSTPGTYTYTVNGTSPCPSASSEVLVSVVTNADAGLPGAVALCNTDAAIDLFTELGGTPDLGGAWSGPSTVTGGQYDPATMTPGVYTYTITVPAPCVNASRTVTVTEVAPPNAGSDGTLTLCISSPASSLFAALGGAPQAAGTWSGPSAVVGGLFNPATMTAGVYTYTVAGTSPCPADAASVTVTVVDAPDAGTPGTITLCNTDAAIDLFAELGGTPDLGGAWTGPSAVTGGQYDPATMTPGVYTYTITVPAPCVNASSTVTVTEVAPPNAGNDGTLTLCISSPASSLFAALGGAPQAAGTWSGPSAVVGGLFNPATMTAGVYTYTVAGTNPCPTDAASITVTVVDAPDAGTPGTITLCNTDGAIDLFTELGGTPDLGGAWTGPSAVAGGQYDPATMTPGVYTYTITVPAPCVNASSTVTVTEVAPPNAGNDGTLTLCISSPAASLFAALGGAPQTGGTWSGPSAVVGGLFNPATMTAGVYTYTVAGTSPCPTDAASITVTVVDAPDAGTPGTITLCNTDAAFDLFAELGGTPDLGGAWTGPSVVVGGQYDPATMTPGVYTYTITVPAPCVNASSTVTVTEVAPPNAGTDGTLTLCISSPASSLFAALGGAPQVGGTWSGPSAVVGGLFNPGTMTAGVYTYTVAGTSPCPADAASITVTVVDAPDAGTPGTITLCNTDGAIDLFTELGGTPDLGGAWTGPSAVAGGQYDPATMTPGVYTYTITVPAPCVNVSSTVTVSTVAPPDAGEDGALSLCATGASVALPTGLGGSPESGGVWSGPSAVVGDIFDPATMLQGTYTYTVPGIAPCPSDAAIVVVAVSTEPDPGGPGFLTVCRTDIGSDLFERLEGTPDAGGVWTTPTGTSFSGFFDPATMTSGVYTYTIAVPLPCTTVSSTVTVSIVEPPSAGQDGALTLCSIDDARDLFLTLGGSPDLSGTWTTITGASFSGTFDPSVDPASVHFYTVPGTSPCPADTAMVTVTVIAPPDAGTDDILNLCISGDAVELFPSLGGAEPTGTWSGPSGSSFGGTFTPGVDAAGSYSYTVPGATPCPASTATILVNVLNNADAGTDGATTACALPGGVDLFDLLGGTPDAGGDWYAPSGSTCSGIVDPDTALAGTYRYVVVVPAPCVNDTAEVVLELVTPVDAGQPGELTFCSNSATSDLVIGLNGDPDAGGTWSLEGAPVSGSFTPGVHPAGTYVYTMDGTSPCPDASASVLVVVHPLPNAGSDGAVTVCPEAAPVDLFALLGGTPDLGGTWSGPAGSPHTGQFDPSSDAPGLYTYLVTGTTPCPDVTATAAVNIHVVPQPDAGPDLLSCTLEAALQATGEWSSGSWSGPSSITFDNTNSSTTSITALAGGSYTLVWSTISQEGCAASDSVQVIVTDAILPVVTGTDAVCNGACDGNATAVASGGNTMGGGYDYAWSTGSTSATITGLCAGDYSVTVADMNGCTGGTSVTIGEPEVLVIDLVYDVDETCPGTCDGRIIVVDGAGTSFSLDGGMTVQASNTFSGLCPGAYQVWMQDVNGCTAVAPATIATPPPVNAGFIFDPDTLFIDAPLAGFTNTSSSNATSFLWDFGTGDQSTLTSPTYSFPGGLGGSYTVCLTAFDVNSCPDSVCAVVTVLDLLLVHVPNAFTPNGDGINDGFAPLFNLPWVDDYEFLIFDRWGERIFESHVVDEQWDGRLGNEVVETEVYVWKLTCKDALTGDLIERIGHVTVLK